MCGFAGETGLKVRTISVGTTAGQASQTINNANVLDGLTIYGMAVRGGDADRFDRLGNPIVTEQVLKGSFISLKEVDGCPIVDMPLELLKTCCQKPYYYFPEGVQFKAADSSIYYTGPIANLVTGSVYELIIWYK